MTEFTSGFACFVGRPNAGKSTLTNALVGGKIAITSSKPQTTRHAIRGLVNRADAQLILIDTPGLHKPHTLLGERLNALVRSTWSEVDTIGMCLPANETVGEGDKFLDPRAGRRSAANRSSRSPPRPTWSSPTSCATTCCRSSRPAPMRACSGRRSSRCRRWRTTRSTCSPTC